MGAWKISFASEAKERALASVLVVPNLDAEAVPFTFPNPGGGEQFRKAPMAFVPDLVEKLHNFWIRMTSKKRNKIWF